VTSPVLILAPAIPVIAPAMRIKVKIRIENLMEENLRFP
jgi:hypothetical protein